MSLAFIARNLLLVFSFLFLAYVFFRQQQEVRLNWAVFFSSLWVALSLLVVNYISVYLGFWHFHPDEDLTIFIPYDFYFIWLVFWGVLMPFLLRGQFILVTAFCLFCLDVLVMPILAEYGFIILNNQWFWGEILLILIVYLPAHIWVCFFVENKGLRWRSFLQFLTMAMVYCIGLPFMVYLYFPNNIGFNNEMLPYILQLGFVILLPALIAVIDLTNKGKGTPFPYDPTKYLVRSGVYAYIRNPIQWSLTFFFIPLAWFFQSYYLLLGVIVSIAYTIGVSEPQEKIDMQKRFNDVWSKYKKDVPLWYFLWRPVNIPPATIYFKKSCLQCSQLKTWLEKKNPIGLVFEDAAHFKNKTLLQVNYQHENGQLYSSVHAIAHAFEHINLVWASLGWFMRLPGISYFLQLVINSMGLIDVEDVCQKRNE